ncbi:hypothetical protein ACPT9H_18125 [Brevibacillus borstelensis]|uniref:hypothetical protein n=1 Tax=Brevibacillus borstelensis TaxID=45462 RepID=UPI003CE467B2
MKRITIIFSSGAQTQFNVDDFTVNKNYAGEFMGFNWVRNKSLGPQPLRINPDNVDLVLFEEIEEQEEEISEHEVQAETSV